MAVRTWALVLLVGWAGGGCHKDGGDGKTGAEAKAAGPTRKTPGARPPARSDRGEAKMTLGDKPWSADWVRARLSGGALTIRASRTEHTGKRVQRQELHLQIASFKGPGDYTTTASGSRFIGVGMDVKAAQAAGTDERAARAAATQALSGATHLMLMGARVVIEKVSDDEVTGRFSWQPPGKSGDPAITDGTFRAPFARR